MGLDVITESFIKDYIEYYNQGNYLLANAYMNLAFEKIIRDSGYEFVDEKIVLRED